MPAVRRPSDSTSLVMSACVVRLQICKFAHSVCRLGDGVAT